MIANPYYTDSTSLPTFLPIPHVCASVFKWIDGVGTAKASDLFSNANNVPPTFAMKSPLTGKVKLFDYCLEEAVENEYWDGEFQKFTTSCGLIAIVWNC
jgi:hypothetical protein